MTTPIKSGDKVRYIGHNTNLLTQGEIYTTEDAGAFVIVIKEVPGYYHMTSRFEPISDNGLGRAVVRLHKPNVPTGKEHQKLADMMIEEMKKSVK